MYSFEADKLIIIITWYLIDRFLFQGLLMINDFLWSLNDRFLAALSSVAHYIDLHDELLVEKRAYTFSVDEIQVSKVPPSGYKPNLGNKVGVSVTIPQEAFQSLGTSSVRVISSVLHKPTLFDGSNETVSTFSDIISVRFLGSILNDLDTPIIFAVQKLQVAYICMYSTMSYIYTLLDTDT